MLNQFKFSYRPIVLIIVLACLFTSCSDSNTGVNPKNPPDIPRLDKIAMSPNWNYFNIDSSVQPESNFQRGKEVIQKVFKIMDVAKMYYKTFLKPAISKKPVFKDGKWVWTYKSNNSIPSVTQLKLVANKKGKRTIWQLFYSNTTKKIKNKEQGILHGVIRTTNSELHEGSWRFQAIKDSTLILNYRFNLPKYKKIGIRIRGNSNDPKPINKHYFISIGTLNHSIHINTFNNKDYGVSWNTKSNKGYIIINGEKMCWDANYQNVEC